MIRRLWVFILILVLVPGSAYAQRAKLTHSVVNVATTTTTTLAANTARNFLLLENISDTVIDCSFNVAAVNGQGIRIAANGGSLLLDVKFSAQSVACIQAGVGTKTLLVTEGIQ